MRDGFNEGLTELAGPQLVEPLRPRPLDPALEVLHLFHVFGVCRLFVLGGWDATRAEAASARTHGQSDPLTKTTSLYTWGTKPQPPKSAPRKDGSGRREEESIWRLR